MKFNGNTMAAVMAVEQEALPIGGGFMEGTLGTKGIRLTEDVDYGKELPAAAPTGTLFFVEETEVADFVVDQGVTDDGWMFRKWNSGLAECWSTVVVEAEDVTPSAKNERTVALPFPFADTNYAVLITKGKDGHEISSVACSKSNGAHAHSEDSFVMSYVYTNQGSYNVSFHVQVVGRWK